MENFHKFYLAANEAKSNYISKSMGNDTPHFRGVFSNPDAVSCKNEPQEMIECITADNWQQEDIAIENLVPEATIDKRDFDAVFCEEFIPDCDAMMEDTKDGTSLERYADYSECGETVSSARATREKVTIRIKPQSTSTGETGRKSSKRPADFSDRKLICEFCVETFETLKEIRTHHEREHNIRDGLSTQYHKRVKR